MTLRDQEILANEQAWDIPHYGNFSPGEHLLELFLDMSGAKRTHSIVDAGCGSGRGGWALEKAGFVDVRLCDVVDRRDPDVQTMRFTHANIRYPLAPQLGYVLGRKLDWVYCCDVLEHLPEAFTMLAVSHLLDASRKGCFLSICTELDAKGPWAGRALHETVKPFTWWKNCLNEVGHVQDARPRLHAGVYLVTPR